MASVRHNNGTVRASAYYLYFDATDADPSNGPNDRWLGFPLCWLCIVTASLYFVRSGYIYIVGGSLYIAGTRGYIWHSKTANKIWGTAGSGAYYLAFHENKVITTDGPTDRNTGFPLRYLKNFINQFRSKNNRDKNVLNLCRV